MCFKWWIKNVHWQNKHKKMNIYKVSFVLWVDDTSLHFHTIKKCHHCNNYQFILWSVYTTHMYFLFRASLTKVCTPVMMMLIMPSAMVFIILNWMSTVPFTVSGIEVYGVKSIVQCISLHLVLAHPPFTSSGNRWSYIIPKIF